MQNDSMQRGRFLQRSLHRQEARMNGDSTIGSRVAKVNPAELPGYNPFRDRIPLSQLPPSPFEDEKQNESFLSGVHSVLYNGVEYLNGFELVRSLRR